MKKIFILFLSFLLTFNFTIPVSAIKNSPEIEWEKALGGSEWDGANSVQQTTDGGYIVAGRSKSKDGDVTRNHGNDDYWIVKLDRKGEIEWKKVLGGNGIDFPYSIQQTTDEGYIVAGWSKSKDGDVTGNHGDNDYWIVKLDREGELEWEKSLGGSEDDRCRSIQQTIDRGYIVAGWSKSKDGDVTGNHGEFDYWIVKLDREGEIDWKKALGGSGIDYAESIQQTIDGGYIVAGVTQSEDGDIMGNYGVNNNYWIVKLDEVGKIEWEKVLGGSEQDLASSIQQTIDGGYIVAGGSESKDGDVTGNHGEFDYWIVKLDRKGEIEWEKTLGGSGIDFPYSIQQTIDRGYIVVGEVRSEDGDVIGNHGDVDGWIVKLDREGEIDWKKALGGSECDWISSIQQTIDGGYIVAGGSKSKDGYVTGNHGDDDYWIVKLKPDSNNSATTQDKK